MVDVLLNINRSILLFTLAVNFALAIFIYYRNTQSLINKAFSLLLLSISVWTLNFLVQLTASNYGTLLFFRRLAPASASFMVSFLLYFSFIFPDREKPLSINEKIFIFAPSCLFSLFALFTPFLINEIVTGNPVFGSLYYFYAFFLMAFFIWSIVRLVLKYHASKDQEKLQILYVLFGIASASVCGLFTSLILPLFGVHYLYSFGPLFTLITAFFISYSIVQHQLLHIEDFLVKGLGIILAMILFLGTLFSVIAGNFSFLLTFYTACIDLFFGAFVYFYNWRARANRSFALLIFCTAVWTLCIYMFANSRDYNSALIWSRLAAASILLVPALFAYFSRVFPREEEPKLRDKIWMFAPAAILGALSFSDLLVKDVILRNWGFELVLGNGFFLYALYVTINFIYAFYVLYKKNLTYSGISRTQIRYVFLGVFLSAVFPVITNIIMPMVGNSQLTITGPSFIIVGIAVLTYSIVRHRLMSIEVVLQKGFIYIFLALLALGLYLLSIFATEKIFQHDVAYSFIIIPGIVAIIIALAYQPLSRKFIDVSDLVFRGRYDYQKTIRQISQKIASVIKLEELSRLIVSSFIDTMKVSEISFLLLEKEKEHFRSVTLSLPRYKKIEIDVSSPIVSWLSQTLDILVKDEIEDEIGRLQGLKNEGETKKKKLEEVRDEMEWLSVSVWVPIAFKGELVGIIALGDKLSGDIFTTEDLGLLSTLANQAAVALDNARLYEEVVNIKDYNEEILQSMVSGVLTVDNKAKIITFNNMAEKITGRKAAVVVGKTCREIWGEKGTITNLIDDILKKEKRYINFESGVISPERGMVPVSFSSTILYDHNRKKIGALLTISDLTDVRELEEKVRRADKLSALATMAAGMAHEIKNPLSSMKVLSQLLPLKFQEEEFRNKFIEIMPREISRIDRIVESLLGFARATAPKYEKMNIESVIADNVQYFTDQAKNAGVEIITEYSPLPEIMGDHDQLSQVFSNLILNAIQAMPDGGQIGIKTSEGKKIENILQNIRVEVADTGHGITPQNLKKLFDPFFTTKYSGTGLGLTITHSIVDGHRGNIDVKSEPGKGTAFIITLPVSQELI